MEGRWTKRRRPDQPPTDRETMRELNELQQELRRLAAERDVVILAHNYQRPEVQGAGSCGRGSRRRARRRGGGVLAGVRSARAWSLDPSEADRADGASSTDPPCQIIAAGAAGPAPERRPKREGPGCAAPRPSKGRSIQWRGLYFSSPATPASSSAPPRTAARRSLKPVSSKIVWTSLTTFSGG